MIHKQRYTLPVVASLAIILSISSVAQAGIGLFVSLRVER